MNDQNSFPKLALEQLRAGCPALTPAAGQSLAEAAVVCLEYQGHKDTTVLRVAGDYTAAYQLAWPALTDQMRRTHNDLEEATEYGACAIAILLIRELVGFTVIERARKGDGFDYWLGEEDALPFQNKARLEVSGILKGGDSSIDARVRQKLEQIERAHATLPGYVVVIEFRRPLAKVVTR